MFKAAREEWKKGLKEFEYEGSDPVNRMLDRLDGSAPSTPNSTSRPRDYSTGKNDAGQSATSPPEDEDLFCLCCRARSKMQTEIGPAY